VNTSEKIGRNDVCRCGSGKKYKKCCGQQAVTAPQRPAAAPLDVTPLLALLRARRHAELETAVRAQLDAHQGAGILWKLLGAAEHSQGKDPLASQEMAARLLPNDAEAQSNLGNALRAHGRLSEAAARHRRAIELHDGYAEAHNNLGSVLRDLGQHEEAAASFRRAVAIRPDFAMAHTNLGNTLRDLGQPAAAAASFRAALELQPQSPELHNSLGNALLDLGDFEAAVQSYGRSLEFKPDSAKVHSNLGSALRDLLRLDESAASYQRALELQPDSPDILTNLAAVQRLLGHAAQADASVARALALNAASTPALLVRADLAADRGDFAVAEDLYRRAFASDPDSAAAWSGIAALRKMGDSDADWLAQAQRLADRPRRPREAAQLRFAMGKYLDDTKQYAAAFASYRAANELIKMHRPPHDREQLSRSFDFIARLYDRDWIERARTSSDSASRPIFVVGMPRSGTSLVEQILASHPAVFGAGELPFWKTASLTVGSRSLEDGPSAALSAEFGDQYRDLLAGLAPAHERVVDKMPANFAHLGVIHAALPEARIIHMRRDPIDTCLSIYFQNFHIAHSYANDLDDLAHYYDDYVGLMRHWHAVLPPDTILDVPYEALVDDAESWSRKMVEFVGLPWDDACLNFHETKRLVSTFSKWQVRQKINRRSVQRWRNYAEFVGPLRRLSPTAADA
jgi:tetratricopeptide (TPR) repeat protein